jgi:transcriptional regulator with XRE-family HTH domain
MRNKQEWFDEKVAAIPKDVREEVNLSSEIIIRVDEILRRKGMTQRELARKLGKSEAVVSRWTTGFPNLTLRSISQLSEALGESLIQVTKD